jgi:hypothetical protein
MVLAWYPSWNLERVRMAGFVSAREGFTPRSDLRVLFFTDISPANTSITSVPSDVSGDPGSRELVPNLEGGRLMSATYGTRLRDELLGG